MTEVTCPHCGFPFDVKVEKPKRQNASEKNKELAVAYIETWNEFAEENGMPKVRTNNEVILAKLATRIREPAFREDFLVALNCIKTFSFYRGLNDTHWKASLEYLTRPGKAEELAAKFISEKQRGRSTSTFAPTSDRLLSRTRGSDLREEPEG